MAGIACSLCNVIPVNYQDWLKHVVRRHRNHPNFYIECQFPSCNYSTKSWPGFRSHYSRSHKREDTSLEFSDDTLPLDNFQDIDQFDMVTASLILKLQARHKLSAVSTNDIIDGFGWLLNEVRKNMGVQANHDIISTSLAKFTTESKRHKFYTDNCRYIEPEKVIVGTQFTAKGGRYREVANCGYIIPFKKSLENFLNNSEVKYYIDHDHFSPDNIMEDICDGEIFSEHPLYSRYPRALQILLYYDDLEMVNGLGSHVSKHKCAMFYYTLANIPPYMRSKWCSINLLGIIKTKYLVRHGLEPFLRDFISTVKDLSNQGVTLTIQNEQRLLRGSLIGVLGDQPATNFMGGYKISGSFAFKPCKTCAVSNNQMKILTDSQLLKERSQDLHRRRCAELDSMTKRNRKYFSKMWGINSKTPLLDIPFFQLSKMITHDGMHVLHEGLLPYNISLFLQDAINDGILTLKWLNTNLAKFQYSYLDSDNKPELIVQKHLQKGSLKQTAAAMVTLTYVLPLILHTKADMLGEKYRNLMRLIVISLLINSPKCTVDTAGQLQVLIETYLTYFRRLYPHTNLRPKAHSLLHFPTQMIRYGALKNLNCFRYESKNNFFKSCHFKNYINLPYSMAKAHQLNNCYNFLNCNQDEGYLNTISTKDLVREGQTHMFLDHYPDLINEFSAKILMAYNVVDANDIQVYCTPEFTIRGLTYRPQSCLFLGETDNWPLFVEIEALYVYKETKFFVCRVLETLDYFWEANAYDVSSTNTKKVLKADELRNEWPLPKYQLGTKNFVTNRFSHFPGVFF